MIAHARRLKARRFIAALCHTVETGDNGGDQQQKRAKYERRKQIKNGRADSPRP